jgi:hypothetical protein
MQSTGRYARVTAHASVFCCDHRDERDRRCERAYLVGLGMGDSVTSNDIADAEANGWIIGDRDYCPDHADAHRDDEETDEAQS